jgi:[CysO sulfur-carrier protein]-S-L-cysteine hydrolase
MQLLIPPEIATRLADALSNAGRREIGGILMGEHIGPNKFRVKDLTIQRKGGTFATFVRLVSEILTPLRAFFESTKHDYTKFNYLGEWHSHHSFALRPSTKDDATMREMVSDPQLGARFVILFLVRLDEHDLLDGAVTIYQPGMPPFPGKVVREDQHQPKQGEKIANNNFYSP